MEKFVFLVVSTHPEVTRWWGTNNDVKAIMDDDETAVIIRGNQVAVEFGNSIVWQDIPDGNSQS